MAEEMAKKRLSKRLRIRSSKLAQKELSQQRANLKERVLKRVPNPKPKTKLTFADIDLSKFASFEEVQKFLESQEEVPTDPLGQVRANACYGFYHTSKPRDSSAALMVTNKLISDKGGKLYKQLCTVQAKRRFAFFSLVRSLKSKKLAILYPHINDMLKRYFKSSVKNIESFLAMKPVESTYENWQKFILSVDISKFRQHFFPCFCKSKYVDELLLKSDDTKRPRFILGKHGKFVYTDSHKCRSSVVALSYGDRKTIFLLQLFDLLSTSIANSPLKAFKNTIKSLSDSRTFRELFRLLSLCSITRQDSKFYSTLNRVMTLIRFRRVNLKFRPLIKTFNKMFENGKSYLKKILKKNKQVKEPTYDSDDDSYYDYQPSNVDSYSSESEWSYHPLIY